MNASPHFRYYAALVLILLLVLMLRVQARPACANEQVGPAGGLAPDGAASVQRSR